MNEVGSDTAQWHLEQAAIQERIAERYERHSMFWDAEKAHDKAQWHRDQAAALDRKDAAAYDEDGPYDDPSCAPRTGYIEGV